MAQPTLQQLTAFRAVAEFGGFSSAADELRMSQPAVSQQIRQLEELLEVQLFERRARGTVLTAAGEALLPLAHRATDAVDALLLEAEAQHGGLRRLRIAAIPTIAPYLLPDVIGALKRSHPDLVLQVSELRTADVLAELEANRIDLGLIATDEDAVASIALGEDDFLVAVPEDSPLASEPSVSATVLRERDVLLLQDGHCLRGQAQAVCAAVGRASTHDVSATGLGTVCQMVAAGQGITLLPALAVPIECRPGSGIRAVPLRDAAGRTLRIAWRRTSAHADELRSIAEQLRDALGRSRDHAAKRTDASSNP